MKFTVLFVVVALCACRMPEEAKAAKILIVFGIPSYSHQVPFQPLWRELQKRGHEITLVSVTHTPMKNLTNFKQIKVDGSQTHINKVSFIEIRLKKISWLQYMSNLRNQSLLYTENVWNNTELKALYAPGSNQTFDVLFIQMYFMPSLFALSHRFNAPIIGLSPLPLISAENYRIGGLVLPSHESTCEISRPTGTSPSFWKRLTNFYKLWYFVYHTHQVLEPVHQMLAEKYFEKPLPPVFDFMKNISLVFMNEIPAFTFARPQLPNIIQFHTLPLSDKLEPLPMDLKKFVDNATDGFVYFSMGTAARFEDMPKDMQLIFYDVFVRLPYKVVVKAPKTLDWTSDRVYIGKWFPQKSVLAHPNIKLFIYQGGLQSTQEAIHFAVPILGFPVMSDQDFQLQQVVLRGIGKRMNLETLTREGLDSNIREVIINGRYKENMIKLRELINDTPYNMIQNLVWWTEYVIRHKGAPHLQTDLAWLPWYQYCDMDVVAFLSIVAFVIIFSTIWIMVKLLAFVHKWWATVPVNIKKKTN